MESFRAGLHAPEKQAVFRTGQHGKRALLAAGVAAGSGDMLFLYTGGVVRAEDIKGNVYTETYLKQYLDELVKREISLKGIADGLQNDLERFSEGRGQELDRTMVLLRYYG